LHAQRRARREENKDKGPSRPETPSAGLPDFSEPLMNGARIVSESLTRLDWRTNLARAWSESRAVLQKYFKELGLAAVIITLGILLLSVASPSKRLQMFGGRMEYRFRTTAAFPYLITYSTELKSWSERGGRLDTPLQSGQRSEIGNVFLKASAMKASQSGPVRKKTQDVLMQAKEWIVTQTDLMPQNIPLNHPSLKTLRIKLNSEGDIVSRDTNYSTRLGRALTFIMPRWPSESLRPGAEWYEAVGWVQTLGDWKIFWRGQMHWKLVGFEPYEQMAAAHLTYHAEVTPAIWEGPAWAKKAVKRVTYSGTGDGEAYFDTRKRQIISNTYSQEGALTIPIDNIYRIPAEQRVGRMPRRRWGQPAQAESGRLILQLKEKLDVHKR
jgi:hypothetical protein